MRVEPIRNQCSVAFPSGKGMSNAFAHNQSGGHVRLIQTLDEATRLLNRYGFVLVTVNQNRWRSVSSHMRHRRVLLQHPPYLLPRGERPPGVGLGTGVIELETGIDASVPLLHEVHDGLSRCAEIQEVSRREKTTGCLHSARFAFDNIVGRRISIDALHRDDQGEQPASGGTADTEALTIDSKFRCTVTDEPYGPLHITHLVLQVEYRCAPMDDGKHRVAMLHERPD